MARTGVSVEETLRFASPVYLIDMVMTARHFCQSPELYGSIHLANPNAKEVVTAFQESLNAWQSAVEQGDLVAFERLFAETHEFFGDVSEHAMEQSTYLIDRLIERG
jgi:chorismate mutase/prephenate dehydrogenase